MSTEQLAQIVIEKLRPDMKDFLEDELYWFTYDKNLSELDGIIKRKLGVDTLVRMVNKWMRYGFSSGAAHHCATDVAETLLSLCPEEFTGKFVFN